MCLPVVRVNGISMSEHKNQRRLYIPADYQLQVQSPCFVGRNRPDHHSWQQHDKRNIGACPALVHASVHRHVQPPLFAAIRK